MSIFITIGAFACRTSPTEAAHAERDYKRVLQGGSPRLSTDGDLVLEFHYVAGVPSFLLGPAGSPTRAFAVEREPPLTWWDLAPTADQVYLVRNDGTVSRMSLDDGAVDSIATLEGTPQSVAAIWTTGTLVVWEKRQPSGLKVTELTLSDGGQRVLFYSESASDVVLSASLSPRFVLGRSWQRTGRGVELDRVTISTPEGKQLGPPFNQVGWIWDRDPVPRIGDGAIRMMGSRDDLSGWGTIDNNGWNADWLPTSADATRWLVSDDGTVEAVAEESGRLHWHAFTKTGEQVATIQKRLEADIAVLERSADDTKWLLEAWSGSMLTTQWVYNTVTGDLVRVGAKWGPADKIEWQPVEPLAMVARDGTPFTSYLTRPKASHFGPAPWPLVVLVHGGPWSGRFRWTWDEEVQRLAAQGYAVMAVNFRGTAGWGWNRIDGTPFGDEMLQDVEDSISWAIIEGVADPARVAVSGSSFGGYAALRLATSQTLRLRCSFAGLTYGNLTAEGSNLNVDALGDLEWRVAHSPDRDTQNLSGPVFIWSGGSDGENPNAVADFVRNATSNGKTVVWIKFPTEGHGLSSGVNRTALYELQSRFFRQCLGGARSTPGEIPTSANLQVLQGCAAMDTLGLQSTATPPNLMSILPSSDCGYHSSPGN